LFATAHQKFGPVTVGDIALGTHVPLECGELHHSYHVNIPMTGHVQSEHRGIRVTTDSECATVYHPEILTALPHLVGVRRNALCQVRSFRPRHRAQRCTPQHGDHSSSTSGTPANHSGRRRVWAQMVMVLNDQLSRTAFCVNLWSGCSSSKRSSSARSSSPTIRTGAPSSSPPCPGSSRPQRTSRRPTGTCG
jgi:AraC-binding-like domain